MLLSASRLKGTRAGDLSAGLRAALWDGDGGQERAEHRGEKARNKPSQQAGLVLRLPPGGARPPPAAAAAARRAPEVARSCGCEQSKGFFSAS